MSRPTVVRLRLLGGFSVLVGSRTVRDEDWRLKKAKSLVKLLALAPNHRMHRERVMDTLWPELSSGAAANNLRRTLHAARRAFESAPAAPSRYLRLGNEELALCPDGALWVDAEAFEEAAATARGGREPLTYRAAMELYPGELLPEDRYEAWALDRREELRETYLALLLELAGLYEERTEYGPSIEALKRALSEDPAREEAHTGLARLYALSGRSREALRQYERLEEILRRELGEEPGVEGRRLREEILSGRFPPSRPAPEDHTPSGTPDVGPHNLPTTRGSFVGRERDVVEVRRLLAMTNLLTLTGAGGSGKTRLALEVARDLVGFYPDGVWLVELASLSEGGLVPRVVASALGVREQPGRPLEDALVDALRGKKALLVLDNCEHLVEAAARLADMLLGSCPRLRVLATSREPLGVAGEAAWRVPPLSVPDTNSLPAAHDLARYGAVRLFVERACLRLPAFEVTSENARAVAEVCRRLDGIPLAIELATARLTALAVDQVADRLEDSLKLLTGGVRTAAPRHRTMRATLEWSYELLEDPEKELFERLSVFAGGWTLEAAEAVGADGGIDEGDVLDLLVRLIDKSLVVAGTEAAPRYRMLEPVRQYAREKLEEGEEAQATSNRHVLWCLEFARRAERELSGPDQALWLDQLETEHDNLRAALRWSLDGREAELGLELAAAMWLFWYTRGYLSEGREWLEKAALASSARELRLKAWALCNAGHLAAQQGDLGGARASVEESLSLSRELRDKGGIASALSLLGVVAMLGQQDLETVPALYEEAMSLREEIEDPRAHAYLLLFSGIMAVGRGDWERAEALFEESLALYREIRDDIGAGMCLTNLGLNAVAQGNPAHATARFRENLRVVAGSNKAALLHNFVGLACAAAAQGQPIRAARLWGVAEAIQEAFDLRITPMTRERINHDEHLSTARSRLGEPAFEAARAEGKDMSGEEAVRFASGDVGPASPETPESAASGNDVELLRMRAEALGRAGYLAVFQDDYEAARGLLEEALSLFRELEDKEGIASSLTHLGLAAVAVQRDLETVPALLEQASSLRPELTDRHTIGMMLILSGLLAASLDDWERAVEDHEEALRLFHEIGDSQGIIMCTTNLGLLALIRADYGRATRLLEKSLRMSRGLDHKAGIHYSLIGMAGVAARQGQPDRAARLWGADEAMRETFGIQLQSMGRNHLDYEGDVAAVRLQLGEAAFEAAWAEGKAMNGEEALRFALGDIEPVPPEVPATVGDPLRDLTRREQKIAALVSRGLANRRIASELSISERTVETHVRNVLKKLNLRSRSQLAVLWASEQRPPANEQS